MSKSTIAETALKKLRRMESNMVCPNCGTAAPMGIGFGSVCIKYKTFVCDLCKTSHQAISHRVKSITMSNWTIEEVRELSSQQFGGNEACLHTWLANAPKCGAKYPGGTRPKAGDKIEFFKQFVTDCYENGKFRATTPYVPSGNDASAFTAEPKKQPAKVESGIKLKNPSSASSENLSTQFKSAVQVNDLLDSDSFDQFQSASGSNSPFDPFGGGNAQQAAAPRGVSSFDEFGTNSGTPSPVPQFQQQQDFFSTPPAVASFGNQSSFDAFNQPPPAAPVSSGFNNRSTNSDFGGLLSATPPPPAPVAVDLFGSSDLLLQPVKAGTNITTTPSFGAAAKPNNPQPSPFGGMSSSGGSTPTTAVIGGKVSVMLAPPAAPMGQGGMRMNNGMMPPSGLNGGGGGFGGNNFNATNGQNGGGMPFSGLGNPNAFTASSGVSGGGGVGGIMGGGNSNARAPPVSTMGGGFRPQGAAGIAPSVAATGGRPSGLTGASAISNLADFNLGVLTPNNPVKSSNNGRPTPQTSSFDFLQSTMQHHLQTSGVPVSHASPVPSVSSTASLQSLSVKSSTNQPVMLNNQHMNFMSGNQGPGGMLHSASAPSGMNHMGGAAGGGFHNAQQGQGHNSFAGLGNVSSGMGMSGGGGMNNNPNNNNINNQRGPAMGGGPMGVGGGMSAMGGGNNNNNNNQFRANNNSSQPSNPFKM